MRLFSSEDKESLGPSGIANIKVTQNIQLKVGVDIFRDVVSATIKSTVEDVFPSTTKVVKIDIESTIGLSDSEIIIHTDQKSVLMSEIDMLVALLNENLSVFDSVFGNDIAVKKRSGTVRAKIHDFERLEDKGIIDGPLSSKQEVTFTAKMSGIKETLKSDYESYLEYMITDPRGIPDTGSASAAISEQNLESINIDIADRQIKMLVDESSISIRDLNEITEAINNPSGRLLNTKYVNKHTDRPEELLSSAITNTEIIETELEVVL